MKKFFITTAIDYTNDVVHIGHAYQKILADAIARYKKTKGEKVYFLTGTDEHGQKVEKAAKESKTSPQKFVDKIVAEDKKEWEALKIKYDRFIRTTDKDHIKTAQEFYLRAKANGDIYLSKYEGLYCESCENFLEEDELIKGKCQFHQNKKPLRLSEENYFFRLSKYQSFIENHLRKNKKFIIPETKRREIYLFVKRGLKDFSVSRLRENVSWGIPVPDDPRHTIYVWFDALINYLTFGKKIGCWPADLHIIGKDILRFHAVYWPAMLKSAGYALPKSILVHEFITLKGKKISKSEGNVIRPTELVKKFGTDGVRYFFLRFGPLYKDVDITLERISSSYNSDLANGLGNLFARIIAMAERENLKVEENKDLHFSKEVDKALSDYKFNEALNFIWEKISEADRFINERGVWNLKGSQKRASLFNLLGRVRQIGFDLKPFMPETSERILKMVKGPKIRRVPPLFPKLKKFSHQT